MDVSAVVSRGGGASRMRFVFRLEGIGWDEALSKFTGIDKETFAELVPLVLADEFHSVFDGVEKAAQRVHYREGIKACHAPRRWMKSGRTLSR